MDPRRGYSQDPSPSESTGSWYGEEPDWERSAGRGSSYDPYRAPEQRGGSSGYGDLPPAPAAPPLPPVGPRSGEPLPPPGYMPTSGATGPSGRLLTDPIGSQTGELSLDEVSRRHAESFDRTQMRRTVPVSGPGGPVPQGSEPTGSVYRGRRPGLAALLIVLTVAFEIPVLRVFATSALASRVDATGTISSIFMILGLPTFGLGLYGLIGGAAAATHGSRAWLRTPLVYLPVGLVLFVSAALAA